MRDPSNPFPTIVLATGAAVLLVAIAVGQRMGDRVLGEATETTLPSIELATPEPYATSGPFGPDWKRSETLSAAADPRFPDPRVPPQPLPTPVPLPPAPVVPGTPTPNPNIPIWRQKPLPTATPIPTEIPTENPLASPEATPPPHPNHP
jgi:hypothetical protein